MKDDRVKELAEYILHWQASGVEPAGAVDAAVDALNDQIAISDIHGDGDLARRVQEIRSAVAPLLRAAPGMSGYIATIDGICHDVQEVERERDEARAALRIADELIEDLMQYATQSWDWKYGDYWREEQAKVRAALSAPAPKKVTK